MRDVNKGNPLKKAVIKQQMMDARMIFTFLYTRIIRQIKATIIPKISYNGEIARKKGQKMHYVTERAVFELRQEGLVLIEIAPGIDLQTQVLDLMEYKPLISENLKEMDPAIFNTEGAFGLKNYL